MEYSYLLITFQEFAGIHTCSGSFTVVVLPYATFRVRYLPIVALAEYWSGHQSSKVPVSYFSVNPTVPPVLMFA